MTILLGEELGYARKGPYITITNFCTATGFALQLHFHLGLVRLDFDSFECPAEGIALEILAPEVKMALYRSFRPGGRGIFRFSTVADCKTLLKRVD